jgi:hypothetical protein
MTTHATPHAIHFITAALVCLFVASGCGERSYILDPGDFAPTSDAKLQNCFEGAQAQLTRFSSVCAKTSDHSLSGEVADGLEFPGEMVASLEAPCAEGPTPSVGISIGRNAVVLDFAEVVRRGRFPSAEFNGYIIDLLLTRENAQLVGALIDRERTTIAVDANDISVEPDRIEINLEGVVYEPGSMLEIKLVFLDAPAIPEDA